jgi:hypothetical protein
VVEVMVEILTITGLMELKILVEVEEEGGRMLLVMAVPVAQELS